MRMAWHGCVAAARPSGFLTRHLRAGSFFTASLLVCLAARADLPPGFDLTATRSVSGQFVISGSKEFSPLAESPQLMDATNLIRLEPATLSVTVERIKDSLWHALGIESEPDEQGEFFLALHPARTLDDEVTIVAQSSGRQWNYEIQLPDVLPKTRFMRALTGALLLEYANRHGGASGHTTEVPDWLVDGMAQRLLWNDTENLILSAPNGVVDGLAQVRTVATERGLDPLAGARQVLGSQPALSFEQMSWPTESQTDGDDGGVYRASSALFVDALLNLRDGPADVRVMLGRLPGCHNWQTAFQDAFKGYFPRPLDLEKWWAVQVVSFVSRGAGPGWTPAVSRYKLDEILSVPVDVRYDSNALPSHAEVSMQTVIRNFDEPEQISVLEIKLRDLEAAELRLAAPLAGLADRYRLTLAAYLGVRSELPEARPAGRVALVSRRADVRSTLKTLDELDALRFKLEAAVKPDVLTP